MAEQHDEIRLDYADLEAARRDRLRDFRYGLLVRTRQRLAPGDGVVVVITLARERAVIRARGTVRLLTPLVNGALVGLSLEADTHRMRVQLDLLFARRTAGALPG